MAPAALLAEERVMRGVPRELSTRRPDGMVASSRAADWPPARRAFTATGTLSDRTTEDPVQFALGSWQLHLRRRMSDEPPPAKAAWARLLERSYDTIGYLEQNVSPRLALECFLLECRRAS